MISDIFFPFRCTLPRAFRQNRDYDWARWNTKKKTITVKHPNA